MIFSNLFLNNPLLKIVLFVSKKVIKLVNKFLHVSSNVDIVDGLSSVTNALARKGDILRDIVSLSYMLKT